MIVCSRCGEQYNAGHVCFGPKGTPLERAAKRLRLGEVLFRDEAAAVLAVIDPPHGAAVPL